MMQQAEHILCLCMYYCSSAKWESISSRYKISKYDSTLYVGMVQGVSNSQYIGIGIKLRKLSKTTKRRLRHYTIEPDAPSTSVSSSARNPRSPISSKDLSQNPPSLNDSPADPVDPNELTF